VKPTINELTLEDARHLRAAEGWLGLGDFVSASNELEEITARERAHPAVLSLRYAIYAKAGRWDMAAEVAEGLAAMLPDKPDIWVNLADATRRKTGGGIPEAKRILLVAQVKFPKEYRIPFNLACYCAQLGELKEAGQWLKKAMAIDEKTVQKLALDDPDLKPLWDSMSGTIWKRE
jgi:predicted Zn-dependent protease